MQKKQSGIIYLDRNGFLFFEKTLPQVISIPFQPDVVANLDILDRDKIKNQVKQLLTTHKIKPTTLIIILATGVLFEKILPEVTEEQKLDEIKKFLENMPFENVSTITYKLEKGYRVIAMNRDLYETIKETFASEGFTVVAVVPVFSLGKDIDLSHGFSLEMGNRILKKFSSISPDDYVVHKEEKTERYENKIENKIAVFSSKNKRLTILIAIFALLILLLVAFIMFSPQDKKTGQKLTQKTPMATVAIVPPTATPTEAIGSESAVLEQTTIEIFYKPGNLGGAVDLRKKLQNLGYQKIEIATSDSSSLANTLVVFSTNVANNIQKTITTELESLYGTITARANPDTLFDITITLP